MLGKPYFLLHLPFLPRLVKETTPGTAVSPPQFIPLADESPYQPGECGVITEEMLREAMDEMYRSDVWQAFNG